MNVCATRLQFPIVKCDTCGNVDGVWEWVRQRKREKNKVDDGGDANVMSNCSNRIEMGEHQIDAHIVL